MTWEFVGETSDCLTLVHDDGYLIHGTELESADGESTWIIEVTDAENGRMIEQERVQVEDRIEVHSIVERYRDAYP